MTKQTPDQIAESIRHAAAVFEGLIGVAELLESLAPFEEARDALIAETQALAEKKASIDAEIRRLTVEASAIRKEHLDARTRMGTEISHLEHTRAEAERMAEEAEHRVRRARMEYDALPNVARAALDAEVVRLRSTFEALQTSVLNAVKALKL